VFMGTPHRTRFDELISMYTVVHPLHTSVVVKPLLGLGLGLCLIVIGFGLGFGLMKY